MTLFRLSSNHFSTDERGNGGGRIREVPRSTLVQNPEQERVSDARTAAIELKRIVRKSPGKYPPSIRRMITSNLSAVPEKIPYDLSTTLETLARMSLTRSQLVLLMWDEVFNAAQSGELAEIQLKSDTAAFKWRLAQDIVAQKEAVMRDLGSEDITDEEKEILCSVDKLSLTPADRLHELLCEYLSGPHSMKKYIHALAGGAALTAICGFITEMVCRGYRCVSRFIDPVLEQLEKPVLDRSELKIYWLSLKAEVMLVVTRSRQLANVMNGPFKNIILSSELLNEATRAQLSTTKHVANNKFTTLQNMECYGHKLEQLLQWAHITREEIEKLRHDFVAIKNDLGSIHILPFSHEEPVDYIGRMFNEVNIVHAGELPAHIDRRMPNMMLTHFILNARQYSADHRPLNIKMSQEPDGVTVEDNGKGISVQRLARLQDALVDGRRVTSERKDGSGSGIRDSVVLLARLLGNHPQLKSVALTIASDTSGGTTVRVGWGADSPQASVDRVPKHFRWIQISCELDAQQAADDLTATIRISGNVRRPETIVARPLINPFAGHLNARSIR